MSDLVGLADELADEYNVKKGELYGFLIGAELFDWSEAKARRKAEESYGDGDA
jgi:hypothetical protein